MDRDRLRNSLFWLIPAGIAATAAVLGVRALRNGPPEPPQESPSLKFNLCESGRYLCRKGAVLMTTGEEAVAPGPAPSGAPPETGSDGCVRKEIAKCARTCVADRVT